MSIEDSKRLQRIIADYAAATAKGESPGRQQLLLTHPDLAEELQSFFGDYETSGSATFEATLLHRSADADTSPISPAEERVRDTTRGIDDPTSPLNDGAANTLAADSQRTIVRQVGDYELLSEVARGGMGVVYKARQISLNRIVAIKMILAGQLACDADVQRFRAEAEAAANLDHPGIVSVFEVGCHEHQHYFSMGFVEGQSLAERIAEGPLPADEAVRLVRQVADAVQHAHERNVIHRDLKPANVLVDHSGHARVTDFGLAKRTRVDSNLTGTGQILGTPSYMPPEQASGGEAEVDRTADVYSLGAILYALLTGRPPFQAATPMETLLQVLERDPVPPRQLNSDVQRDLEIICLKCLRKEPGKRYASAQAMSEDLERLQTGRPIQARPASAVERAVKGARRRPVVTALTVLLVFVSTLGFAGVTWQWREAEAARLAELENRKKVERLTAELLELYSRLDASADTVPNADDHLTLEADGPTSTSDDAEPFSRESKGPAADDHFGDRARRKADSVEPREQLASPPAPATSANDMRPGADELRLRDRQPLKRQRGQTARRLELESQLRGKISELREVAPHLADQYQKLAPR